MLRKTFRAIGWTAAGLVALCVLVYLIALVINWRDRDPSVAAVRFTGLHRDRPAVADDENAFVYLQRWKAGPGGSAALPPAVRKFLDICRPSHRRECAPGFDRADGVFEQWYAADGALLDGYAVLIDLTGWREDSAVSVEETMPWYERASDGQKMLLLRARELAKQGDAAAVRELLERDLRFWRQVLQSSDILISKMTASALLNRHFEWGNLILRKLPAPRRSAGIPAGWSLPLSDAERSMERCLAGEWVYATGRVRRAPADSFGVYQGELIARASAWLVRPMYQLQDTMNQYAENYASLSHAFAAPMAEYPRVVADERERAQQELTERFPFRRIYNFPGDWMFALTMASSDLTIYPVRVSDVEGVRRAALTAAMLRAAGVDKENVSAALASADQRDPYSDRPFEWDEERQAILFRGLQTGERGEHRLYY